MADTPMLHNPLNHWNVALLIANFWSVSAFVKIDRDAQSGLSGAISSSLIFNQNVIYRRNILSVCELVSSNKSNVCFLSQSSTSNFPFLNFEILSSRKA